MNVFSAFLFVFDLEIPNQDIDCYKFKLQKINYIFQTTRDCISFILPLDIIRFLVLKISFIRYTNFAVLLTLESVSHMCIYHSTEIYISSMLISFCI